MTAWLGERRIDAVVIGTSAGGVEALATILPALPAASRVPVFVVLHLPRERPSLIVRVLASKCAVSVVEAEDKSPVREGVVYVAPPDYHLLIDEGPILALSSDELVNYSRPSIDVLFESAAEVYRDRLLGIILTGASEDGAAGLASVGRMGGATVVQTPESALATPMVKAAVERARPDVILPLDDIARLLGALGAGHVA